MKVSPSAIYVGLIILCFLGSTFAAFEKFIVNEDFAYFVTEDEIPDQFDPATYTTP